MIVIDLHLARGASFGGFTVHDRGGPYGRTKGAKRVVAVDVKGLPVAAVVVPASTHENRASAWRVEVAHGRLGRSRRLAKSFENTTTSATGWLKVACIAKTLRHLSRERARRRPAALAA